MSIKKIILSATIFILTIGAYNTTFASNSMSWNDFVEYMDDEYQIDISNKEAMGIDSNAYTNFKNGFINANGFFMFENNNNEVLKSYSMTQANGNLILFYSNEKIPVIEIRIQNREYDFIVSDSSEIYYVFNKDTKQISNNGIRYNGSGGGVIAFKYKMTNSETEENFYNEENTKYVLHDRLLCASNMTFVVKDYTKYSETNLLGYVYSLTVPVFKKTPAPWTQGGGTGDGGGTIGGDNIIYDYTDESYEYFKKTYFKPYLEFKAPINGYVDYTGNWDRGTTWEINNTTYKDNEFYLYVYSGDGSVDGNLYNGYIYLDVFKANYLTSGDINYTYFTTKKAIPGATYITGEEVSENVMKFTFTLKRCFNGEEEETIPNFNEGWLNDLSTNSDYIFRLRFEDALFLTTSKTSWFYFNLQSPLNLYRNTEQYNIPKEYTSELPFGYGGPSYNSDGSFNFGGGGFRDENGNQIIETSDFSSILNSAKSFLSNFLGFFDIFPAWFNTLIALALTIAIVCRIIGR